MIKFPSINQFRHVVRHVKTNAQFVGKDADGNSIYDESRELPTLNFVGRPKIHGTNAGIVYDCESGEITYQSRERVLDLVTDNVQFMLIQKGNEFLWRAYFEWIAGRAVADKIAVYGEWCGQGIQRGVAVSQLPKMFVVFATKIIFEDGEEWINYYYDGLNIPNVYHISMFPSWTIDIDFKYPELAQNKMVEITEEVEKECPVGKHFGVSGIGEGVVWSCTHEDWNDSGTWFKVKGEKHSATKVKTVSAIDVEAIENMRSFVEYAVTESRLEQGLDNLVREQMKPLEMSSMGDFLRWLYQDIMKEEQDTIVANMIDPKKIGSAVANVARPWYVNRLNSMN